MASKNDFPTISESDSIYYQYKWQISFYSSDDEENKIHPDSLLKLTINKQYKDLITPIMTGQFRFNITDLFELKDMRKKCLCEITCKSYTYMPNVTDKSTPYTLVDTHIEFSTTFIPIFDSNAFKQKFSEAEMTEEKEQEYAGVRKPSDLSSPTIVTYVTFFSLQSQKAMKKYYNVVIDSGNDIGTVLTWILENLDIDGYILDKPANEEELPQVIIPPFNFTQAVKYLQSMYGVYENGIMAFIDFDNICYILDKYSQEHDGEEDEPLLTHVYVKDIQESGPGQLMRSENEDEEAMYIGTPIIKNTEVDVLQGEIEGDAFVFSSFRQSIDAVAFDKENKIVSSSVRPIGSAMLHNTESHSESGKKIICDYDELNNWYNMTSVFNETEATSQQMSIILENVNINDFKPNKLVELHYADVMKELEYGGLWFLNTVQFDFVSTATDKLVKTSEDTETEQEEGYTPFMTTCNSYIMLSKRHS